MRLSKYIVGHFSTQGRLLLLAGMLLLGGCVTQQPVSTVLPPLLHHGKVEPVADVDVLAVSPEMEDFLERYILLYPNLQTRLHLLTTAVTSSGVLGFEYREGSTMTAAEAFESRSGNCIGFANMMIALARRAGLQAHYQEVFRRPQWISRNNTVLLIKHVNVVVETSRYTYVMDISGINISPNARRRIVMDDYAKALYLNNLGAEALLKNDLATAYAYMGKAVATDPQMTDSWVNLGVVYGRNEQLDSAELVLRRALQIDSTQYSAMSNLYEVYLERGNLEAAQDLHAKVEKYRRANPYYLMFLSEEALALEQFDESIDLLRRAIKKRDDDHILYFALAKTQYLSGETIAAENSLGRARELAPEDWIAHYNRPLDVLVAEAVAQAEEEAAEEAAKEALRASLIQ